MVATVGASLRSAGFAVLLAVAVRAGPAAVLDGTRPGLVRPAAGVAALRFAAQRGARTRWLGLLLLAVVTWVVDAVSWATPSW